VVDKFDNLQTATLEKPADIFIESFEEKIQTYDSLLGAFALLRFAGEDYMNFSENYFSSLSTYNSIIETAIRDFKNNPTNLFNDPLYKQVQPFLRRKIDENILSEVAKKENQEIVKDKITRVVDLDKLDKVSYVLAVLNTFGVGDESKRRKIDELIISNFKTGVKPSKSELIALCYGLNRGYFVFSSTYKDKKVKFELNSLLDYYTIESLYQYSFNGITKNSNFPYLNDWCPRLVHQNTINKNDYYVLDVIVKGKKKPKILSPEYFSELFHQFFQKGTERYFKDFIEKVANTVYQDTKEELQKEIDSKNQTIQDLKTEIAKLKSFNESKNSFPANVQGNTTDKEIDSKKIKEIVSQYLKYKESNKKSLETEAKNKGICIPKGAKIDDIIILLMTTSDKEVGTIKFDE
jgi:hypothetical protein